MAEVILLDAGPLGLISHPRPSSEIAAWLAGLLSSAFVVIVPEIADYEVRRELLRAGRTKGIRRLNQLKAHLTYLPITTDAMLRAAEFWADTRRAGKPTSHQHALDADMILAGQAATYPARKVTIASANHRHLAAFVPAKAWDEIG